MVFWITHSQLVDSVIHVCKISSFLPWTVKRKGEIPSDQKIPFILKLFTIEIQNPEAILEFDQTQ